MATSRQNRMYHSSASAGQWLWAHLQLVKGWLYSLVDCQAERTIYIVENERRLQSKFYARVFSNSLLNVRSI